MSKEPRSFEDVAGEAIRDFTLSRSTAVAKYGDLLARFGKGEIQSTTFGEESVKLALEESARYTQDAIKLGSAYLDFMSKLTRPADKTPTRVKTTVRRRRSTSKRKRSKAST